MDQLIADVDNIILGFVQGSFGSLTSTVEIVWRLMFIIFIAVFGYKAIISGRFSAPDLIVNCVKIIVLMIIATQWDAFFQFVYRLTTELPSDIAGQIMGAAADSVGSNIETGKTESANTALQTFFDRAMTISAKLLEGAGWDKIGLYLYAFAVWFGAIGLTGFSTMLIILSKLAVSIILAIGPIFILFLIFMNTRNLFEGWLRTLLSYAIIPIFVYTLLALILTMMEAPLIYLEQNSDPTKPLITSVGPFLLTSVISILLLGQIMNMAASITGGLSLSTLGAGNWMVRKGATVLQKSPGTTIKGGVWTDGAIRYPVKTLQVSRERMRMAIKKIRGF